MDRRLRSALVGTGLGLVAALVGLAAARSQMRAGVQPPDLAVSIGPPVESGLPVWGTLPPWELVREDGKPFRSAELLGKPYVADFIFTSCGSVCPRLTSSMRSLQARAPGLGTRSRLVSFTVDPENDTPEVLARYARDSGADASRWVFVTGETEAVQRIVMKGFKLLVGQSDAGDHKIFHAERFVLVDGQARIRGYYENDEASLAKLLADLAHLE